MYANVGILGMIYYNREIIACPRYNISNIFKKWNLNDFDQIAICHNIQFRKYCGSFNTEWSKVIKSLKTLQIISVFFHALIAYKIVSFMNIHLTLAIITL